MPKKTSKKENDVEYWKKVSSRLALTIALMLFGGGIIGSWMNSENRNLESYKESNEKLKRTITTERNTLTKTTNELQACKKKIADMEKALEEIENTDKTAKLISVSDDLREAKKTIKELKEALITLKIENADIKALLN